MRNPKSNASYLAEVNRFIKCYNTKGEMTENVGQMEESGRKTKSTEDEMGHKKDAKYMKKAKETKKQTC